MYINLSTELQRHIRYKVLSDLGEGKTNKSLFETFLNRETEDVVRRNDMAGETRHCGEFSPQTGMGCAQQIALVKTILAVMKYHRGLFFQ